jgi:putative transposase
MDLPEIPLHITHRGVNRAATFLDFEDYSEYRHCLAKAIGEQGVRLHAYVFMGNHVHLLASASTAGAVSRAMQGVGRRYVPAFNRKHGRTGTLWEGRYRSCPVDSGGYLLGVYRYIELNPVRAALVERPEEYPWSSVHGNLGLRSDQLLTPHPVFTALDGARTYRSWLAAGIDSGDLEMIRRHVQRQRALGDERFQAMVAETLQRPAHCRERGRPNLGPGPGQDKLF